MADSKTLPGPSSAAYDPRRAVDDSDFLTVRIGDASRKSQLSDTHLISDCIELTSVEPVPQGDHRYQLVRELAHGGMGVVWRAIDRELERDLAIKVLRENYLDDPDAVRRFFKEAWILGQLQHPGIVPVHDMGRFPDGRPFFVMKLIDGTTLASLLEKRPSVNEDRVRFLKIFEQVALTLAYAHSRGVIHRDLKPSNIMVGEFGEVQVMDWGLARLVDQPETTNEAPAIRPGNITVRRVRPHRLTDSTLNGDIIGTPSYMAPEQAQGSTNLNEQCDVFGLGAVLCEILTGHPPYTSSAVTETLVQAAQGSLAGARDRLRRCAADRELVSLATDCLAPDRENRLQSASDVCRRLAAYLTGIDQRAHQAEVDRAAAVARMTEERKRRRLYLALATSVATILVLLMSAWAWYKHHKAADLYQSHLNRIQAVRKANKALGEATALREQAARGKVDLLAWAAARAGAERAVELASDDLHEPELLDQSQRLLTAVQNEEQVARQHAADQTMLAALEAARLEKTAVRNNRFDTSKADPAYTKAFREYGIDVATLSPDDSIRAIRTRQIMPTLAIALVDWALSRSGPRGDLDPLSRQLIAISQAVDSDPWRTQFRDALLRRDKTAIRALADNVQPEKMQPTTIYLLTTELAHEGQYWQAVNLLRLALVHFPGDFWLNHQAGHMLLGRPGSPESHESVRYYATAVGIRQTSPGARLNLGVALQNIGNLEEAVRQNQEAIRLQPNYADAHNNLGACYMRLDKLKEAQACFQAAIQHQPDHLRAHENLGQVLFDLGKIDESIAQCRKTIAAFPKSYLAHVDLAVALNEKNLLDQAETEIRIAVQMNPKYASSHYVLGNILRSRKKNDEAIASYQQAIRLDPNLAEAMCNLGHALRDTGRYAEAYDAMKRGHETGMRRPSWRYPSEEWLKRIGELAGRGSM